MGFQCSSWTFPRRLNHVLDFKTLFLDVSPPISSRIGSLQRGRFLAHSLKHAINRFQRVQSKMGINRRYCSPSKAGPHEKPFFNQFKLIEKEKRDLECPKWPKIGPRDLVQESWWSENSTTLSTSFGSSYPANIVSCRKKSLNVDSPSFTPGTLSVPGKISSHAANAAPFTPRGGISGKILPRLRRWAY